MLERLCCSPKLHTTQRTPKFTLCGFSHLTHTLSSLLGAICHDLARDFKPLAGGAQVALAHIQPLEVIVIVIKPAGERHACCDTAHHGDRGGAGDMRSPRYEDVAFDIEIQTNFLGNFRSTRIRLQPT
jgi:hypothetical protein